MNSAARKAKSANFRKLSLLSGVLLFLSLGFQLSPLPADAYTIEGKIEHVETMPAMEQSQRKGAQFDLNAAEEIHPNNHWVQIPAWMAGTWSVREETAVLRQDMRSGSIDRVPFRFKARQEFTYGSQRDRQGNIWHFIGAPYTSKTNLSDYDEIHEVKEKEFLTVSNHQVTIRTVVGVIRVSSTGRVKDSFQQESITNYAPMEDGYMKLTSSTKTFSDTGKPLHLQENEADIKRVKAFVERDSADNKDLRSLFRHFLTTNGLSNLMP